MFLPVKTLYSEYHFGENPFSSLSFKSSKESLQDTIESTSFQIITGLDVSSHSSRITSSIPAFQKSNNKVQSKQVIGPGIDGHIFYNLHNTSHQVALLLRTADCTTLTLISKDEDLMGIIHIGWQGLTGGIIENLCNELKNLGKSPEDILMYIGPMAGAGYEFSLLDYETKILPFVKEKSLEDKIEYTEKGNDKVSFHFKKLVRGSLLSSGFISSQISDSGRDTLDPDENLPFWRKGNKERISTIIYSLPKGD